MSWQLWPKTDDKGLARYVLPEAANGLKIPALPDHIPQDPATRLALVEAIYEALREQGITYRTEDYQTDLGRQSIRHPDTVLGGPKVGTCLDLAVLFCGIALWHDLLPILVVLDGHAFVAVSLRHNRRDWESRTRTERALFVDGVLRGDGATAAADLVRFFNEGDGTFLPIECTGFSRAVDLSDAVPEGRGREGGLLPFARAVTAAREHLASDPASDQRKLLFAIDVAALHFSGYQPPPPWAEATGRADVRVYAGAGGQRADYRLETADIVQYQATRFVGREAELKMICDFADGIGPFADRSYLLIEARGGLGKSALMANLVLRATTGQWLGRAPHVIYFFVRRQGGRNTADAFLRAINSQLLTHLGVSGGTPVSLPELKAQFTELWAAIETAAVPESPLVVLIDGLDEMATAAGDGKETIADVLPAPVNPAIRVVVSSRPQPSARERVRREHPLQAAGLLALRTFDVPGVQLLLEKVIATVKPAAERAGPLSTDRVAMVSKRVFALTGGEPLFARFVCEQLVREGVQQLDALERNPPRDAEDYFRGELRALRDSDVSEEAWEILGMLCVAVGPLSREELAGIMQKPPRRITKPLDAVARYLLGERRLELMHPRLREAVTGEFSREELEAANRRMLEWCASYRERGWPQDTPEYMLDYYAAHLAAVGDTAGLFALIDRRWMLCQRSRDDKGTLTEFIRDVSRATATALQASTRDWMAAFRGTYVLATVRSLASSLPPPLIAFLARAGETAEALSYAELVEDPVQRCEVFARLAAVALSQQNDAEVRRLVDTALAALTGPRELLADLDAAYEPLCEVLVGLRDLEGLATALAVAESQGADDWRAGAVALVAATYSRLAHEDRARALVLAHPSWDLFLDRVLDLAFQRSDPNLLKAIIALGDEDKEAAQLGRRAAASHALGDPVGAEALAGEAISAIPAAGSMESWAPLLRHFSRSGMATRFVELRSLAVMGAIETLRVGFSSGPADVVTSLGEVRDVEGLTMIRSAAGTNGDEDGIPDDVLCALAGAFARVGDTERATEAARALESGESDGSYEAIAWVRMVKAYCASDLMESALSAALANTYESRVYALAAVVDAMSARGDDPSNVMALARRTIAEASGMSGEFGQAETYAELAGVLAERGDRARGQRLLDRAESELSSIPPGGITGGTGQALAFAHAKLGAFERARQWFKYSMDDAESLRTFVELMRPSGHADIVSELEQSLHDLFSAGRVGPLLVAVDLAQSAGNLEDARAWLEKAHEAAREDVLSRFSSLCEVAKAMASAGETTASKEVLQELRDTTEWSLLANENITAAPPIQANADKDEDADGEDEDEDEVFVTVSHAVDLSEALLAIGEREQAREMLLRALSIARAGEDFWVNTDVIEVFVRRFAESGALREHYAEIVAVGEKQTHDWEKAQMLGAAARVSIECGDASTGVEFLARGLERAASGGRYAFFELVSQFATRFSLLNVPDLEWRLFEMCEEVDSWWQLGTTATSPDPA